MSKLGKALKFSRSEMDTFNRCRRESFYRYYMDGTGYEFSSPSLPLSMGLALHRGMEQLFKVNLDDAISSAWRELHKHLDNRPQVDEFKKGGFESYAKFTEEQEMLLAGFLYAWRVQFYEGFIREFDVVSVEREIETEILTSLPKHLNEESTEVILQTRCDMVCKSRSDGSIYIPDWKCVKNARDWSVKFTRESQTWCQMHAVEQHLGEPISGAIYWAFIKGDRNADNSQNSNLIYGYRRRLDSGAWQYETSYQRAKGWERFAVWKEPEFGVDPLSRVKFWANWLPSEVRTANFCQSPPIMLDENLASDFLRASAKNVIDIHRALEENNVVPSDFFYRSPNSFICGRCAWRGPCLEGQDIGELRAANALMPRIDHHLLETEE